MAVPEPVLACWQSAVEALPTDGYSEVQPAAALAVVPQAAQAGSQEHAPVVLAETEKEVPDDCFRAAPVAEPRSAELPHRAGYFPAPEAAERCDYSPLPDGFPVAQAEASFLESPDAVPGWVARPDDCFPEFPVVARYGCSQRLDGFLVGQVAAQFRVRLDDYLPERRAEVRCGYFPHPDGFQVDPVEARFRVRLDDYLPERQAEVRCGCSPRLDGSQVGPVEARFQVRPADYFPPREAAAHCGCSPHPDDFPVVQVALHFQEEHQGDHLDFPLVPRFPLVLRRGDCFLGQQAVHQLTYHAVPVATAVPVLAAPPASSSPAEAGPV